VASPRAPPGGSTVVLAKADGEVSRPPRSAVTLSRRYYRPKSPRIRQIYPPQGSWQGARKAR
jgi:hypothetical protein